MMSELKVRYDDQLYQYSKELKDLKESNTQQAYQINELITERQKAISELTAKYDRQLLQYSNEIKNLKDLLSQQTDYINEWNRVRLLSFDIIEPPPASVKRQVPVVLDETDDYLNVCQTLTRQNQRGRLKLRTSQSGSLMPRQPAQSPDASKYLGTTALSDTAITRWTISISIPLRNRDSLRASYVEASWIPSQRVLGGVIHPLNSYDNAFGMQHNFGPKESYVSIGVLGQNYNSSEEFQEIPSAFGWLLLRSGFDDVVQNSNSPYRNARREMLRTDNVVCVYDPRIHILTLHLESTGSTYSMHVPLERAYIHIAISEESVIRCTNGDQVNAK